MDGEPRTLPAQALVAALGSSRTSAPARVGARDRQASRARRLGDAHQPLPRVYAAGDITEYDGKVRLIAVGFGRGRDPPSTTPPVDVDPTAHVFPGPLVGPLTRRPLGWLRRRAYWRVTSRERRGRCGSRCCPTAASRTAAGRASTSATSPASSWPSATPRRVFSGQPYPELDPRRRADEGAQPRPVPRAGPVPHPAAARVPRPPRRRGVPHDVQPPASRASPDLLPPPRCGACWRPRAGEFDVAHDNQTLGDGILGVEADGLPVVTTIHHPITADRRIDLAQATSGGGAHAAAAGTASCACRPRVARRSRSVITVSESSARDIAAECRGRPGTDAGRAARRGREVRAAAHDAAVPGRILAMASADAPLKGSRRCSSPSPSSAPSATCRWCSSRGPPRAASPSASSASSGSPRTCSSPRSRRRGARRLMGSGRGRLRALALRGVLAADRGAHGLRDPPRWWCRGPVRSRGRGRGRRVRGPGHPRRRRRARAGARRAARRPVRRARMGEAAGGACPSGSAAWRAVPRATVEAYEEALAASREEHPVLTVDFDRLGLSPGSGSSTWAAARAPRLRGLPPRGRRGGLRPGRRGLRGGPRALRRDGRGGPGAGGCDQPTSRRGTRSRCPSATASSTGRAAEVLEHIPADLTAIAELARVLRPGGTMAVTVPRWFPELVCWSLSTEYSTPTRAATHPIYSDAELVTKLTGAGLELLGKDHVHGLHTPYWWIKCAVGVRKDRHTAGARLPPGAGLGHHEAARSRPASRSGCSTRWSARAWCSTSASPHERRPVRRGVLDAAAVAGQRRLHRGGPGGGRGHPVDSPAARRRVEPRRGRDGAGRGRSATRRRTGPTTGCSACSDPTGPGPPAWSTAW